MGIMDLVWSLPIVFIIMAFLVVIAPLFIWIHVRAIRYKIDAFLRSLNDHQGR